MEDRIIKIIETATDSQIDDIVNIDLIDSGILDSFGLIELISILEEEFDLEIQPTQVDQKTWRNVESIINLVKSLLCKTEISLK